MMWELIDKIEYLESCMDSNEFKNNFSCYQLDNFELAYGKTSMLCGELAKTEKSLSFTYAVEQNGYSVL